MYPSEQIENLKNALLKMRQHMGFMKERLSPEKFEDLETSLDSALFYLERFALEETNVELQNAINISEHK